MSAAKMYDIKFRRKEDSTKKWIWLGFGTAFDVGFGEGILCTMKVIPLNWDGEFMLSPSKAKKAEEQP